MTALAISLIVAIGLALTPRRDTFCIGALLLVAGSGASAFFMT